jgi:hypothetical protein
MYVYSRQFGSPRNNSPRLETECRNPAASTYEGLGDGFPETGLHEEKKEPAASRSKQFST